MAYSGLTPTDVIRYIKRMIGSVVYDIELTDKEMMDTVFQQTLPTFSKYFPYRFRVLVSEKDEVVGGKSCYKLPDIDGLEITGISKVFLGNFYGYNFNNGLTSGTSNPFDSQLIADFKSVTETPCTWHFLAPNHIEIFPKIMQSNKAIVTVKAIHPRHLRTIKMSLRDEFLHLALLDVLESLYPIRKRFENISSPYGSINLFLEQVERAHDEREQLLERFHENSLRDSDAPRLFIG